jgi:hypothetical protein
MSLIKIWVDDQRKPPSNEWMWYKTYKDAVLALISIPLFTEPNLFNNLEISLDNDLGGKESGEDVLKIIEELVDGGLPIPEIRVHTANPVARDRMELIIRRMKERLTRDG